jgi:tight adherence protein B
MTEAFNSLLVGVSIGFLVLAIPGVLWPILRNWLVKRREHYAHILDQLHQFDENPSVYMALEVLTATLVALPVAYVIPVPVFVVIAFVIGYILPGIYMRQRAVWRVLKIELQLPDAITALSSSVRAGLSLPQAISDAADRVAAPLGQELALMARQYENGLPLDEVLRGAQARLQSRHFNLVGSALAVNRQRGGDVTDILDRIGTSLREIYRLEEKIRVETAGPRLEGKIMVFAPVFIFAMFYLVNPQLVHDSFTSIIGIVISVVATTMIVCAFLWIQKIVSEDV